MQDLGIISPGLEEFRELAAHSRVIPVRLKVLADAETPIGLYRKLAQRPARHLPDGVRSRGRRLVPLFLHRCPSRATLTTQGRPGALAGRAARRRAGRRQPRGRHPRTPWRPCAPTASTGLPPFTSGLVGFLGWETVRHWEKLTSPPGGRPPPARTGPEPRHGHGSARQHGRHRPADRQRHQLRQQLRAGGRGLARRRGPGQGDCWTRSARPWSSRFRCWQSAALRLRLQRPGALGRARLPRALDRGKEAIVDGEVFQVVISRRFEMECGADPLDVYRVLRNTNPSPYMYLFSLEDADGRAVLDRRAPPRRPS